MATSSDIFKIDQLPESLPRGSSAERAMRLLALAALLWSLGAMVCLYMTTNPQPKKFMPLIMRETDSQESRTATIETWRTQYIPTNTQSLLGDRSPLVRYNLDAQLTELPQSEQYWMYARSSSEKPASFKQRLFDMNVGVERFSREYWSRAWLTLEFLVAVAVASILNMIFPRILPSFILLVVAAFPAFVQLEVWSGGGEETPSALWLLPIAGIAFVICSLAIYRWKVAPAAVEVTHNWNKFWLGVLLTGIGVAVFVALVLWGGRVRTNGLAGIGLSIGWGVYLVAVHGWKLVRSLFSKSSMSTQTDSSQAA